MPMPAQPASAIPPPALYVEASPTARLQAALRFMTAAQARGEGVCLLLCTDAPRWREGLCAVLPPPSRLHVLDYAQPSTASSHPSSATGMIQWLCAALDVQPDAAGARVLAWIAMVATRFSRLRQPQPLTPTAPVCLDLLTMLGSPVPHKDWWQRTQGTLGAGWRSAVACHAALPHGFAARLSDLRLALGHAPAHLLQDSEDLGAWLDAGDTVIVRTPAMPAATDAASAARAPGSPNSAGPVSTHPAPVPESPVQDLPHLPAPRIHLRLAMARLQQALAERCAALLDVPASGAPSQDHRWSVALLDVPADLGPSAPTLVAQARAIGVTILQAADPGFLDEASLSALAWRANLTAMDREQTARPVPRSSTARDIFHPGIG